MPLIKRFKNLHSSAVRFTKFVGQSHAIARNYSTTAPVILWRALRLRFQKGFNLEEAALCGMLAPDIPPDVYEACLGRRRFAKLQAGVNPGAFTYLTNDKSIFYAFCTGLMLPIPKLLAVFDKPAGWIYFGRSLSERSAWEKFFESDLPTEFVIKPALGSYGHNVEVYRRTKDGFVDSAGIELSVRGIYDRFDANPLYRKYVIVERLSGHPELEALSNTPYLQTVRIMTYVDRQGRAAAYVGFLKIISGNRAVDNYEYGKTGNMFCDIDMETGRLGPALISSVTTGTTTVTTHPRTGATFADRSVPMWTETLDLALQSALLFLPLRTIGWDIGITPEGPRLVEGNAPYDPFNMLLIAPADARCRSNAARFLKQMEEKA